MFSGCTVLPDSKETKLGSSYQEGSPAAGRNTEIVLVPCRTWKCVPTAISAGVDISEVPEYHLLRQMSSQWGSQKLLQGLVSHELTAYLSVSDLFLSQWIMAILSMGCKTDNFESHNSPKVSFTNIWGLHSNFAECEAFLQSNSSADILALCETNLGDSIDSGNFSVTSYLSLSERIQVLICNLYFNYSSCNLCEGDLPADSYLRLQLALIHSVSYFFFLYWSPTSPLCMVFLFYFI